MDFFHFSFTAYPASAPAVRRAEAALVGRVASRRAALALPEAFHQRRQVFGQARSPGQLLARAGVGEPEAGRVQGQPGGATVIRGGGAVEGTVVDPFAADRRAGFAEVDPHLVR